MSKERIMASIKNGFSSTPDQIFKWRYSDEEAFTHATRIGFYEICRQGERYWVWEGWTDNWTSVSEVVTFYELSVPNVNDLKLNGLYTLESGLKFTHAYSTQEGKLACSYPIAASAYINLDPASGVSEGVFIARFSCGHSSPSGEFSLCKRCI